MPRISVVIPTFNSAPYLGDAIASARSQTFDDIEVIVVDDGSTDGTRELLATHRLDPRVRYLRKEHAGVSRSRNLGIAEARAPFVAFLDADDVWSPHKLKRQLESLDASPGARFCHTAVRVLDAATRPARPIRAREVGLDDLLRRGNLVGTPSSVVVARELLEAVGGFDVGLSQSADWDLWIRLARRTRFLPLDEVLVTYRTHSSNMSGDIPLLERDSVRVLDKAYAIPGPASRGPAMAWNYVVLAKSYCRAGRFRDAARCTALALRHDSRQLRHLSTLPLLLAARRGRPGGFGRSRGVGFEPDGQPRGREAPGHRKGLRGDPVEPANLPHLSDEYAGWDPAGEFPGALEALGYEELPG